MDWGDIFARLTRDREDGAAWEALDRAVRAWARPELWQRGWHIVDDVVAETCAAVSLNLPSARGPETFGGFTRGFYRNARRQALREVRRPEVPLAPGFDIPAPAPEPGGGVAELRPEELRALRDCLSHLPGREQQAVRLRYFEECSAARMAAEMETTEGNARRILCLGIGRLRRCLSDTSAQPRHQHRLQATPQPRPVATVASGDAAGGLAPESGADLDRGGATG